MKFVLLRPYKNDLSGQINEFNAVREKGAKLDRRGRQFKRSSNLSARNQTVTVTPRSGSEIREGFDHALSAKAKSTPKISWATPPSFGHRDTSLLRKSNGRSQSRRTG